MSEHLSRRDQYIIGIAQSQVILPGCHAMKEVRPDVNMVQWICEMADALIYQADRTAKPEPVKAGDGYYKAALEQIVKAGDPNAVSTAVAREALAGTWPLVTGPEAGGEGK